MRSSRVGTVYRFGSSDREERSGAPSGPDLFLHVIPGCPFRNPNWGCK